VARHLPHPSSGPMLATRQAISHPIKPPRRLTARSPQNCGNRAASVLCGRISVNPILIWRTLACSDHCNGLGPPPAGAVLRQESSMARASFYGATQARGGVRHPKWLKRKTLSIARFAARASMRCVS
jgi:hypothetical protein